MRKTSEKSENLKHANLDNELIILPLDEADDLSSFNCDSEELIVSRRSVSSNL